MPLTTGARLGAYEITGAIGAGGMGSSFVVIKGHAAGTSDVVLADGLLGRGAIANR